MLKKYITGEESKGIAWDRDMKIERYTKGDIDNYIKRYGKYMTKDHLELLEFIKNNKYIMDRAYSSYDTSYKNVVLIIGNDMSINIRDDNEASNNMNMYNTVKAKLEYLVSIGFERLYVSQGRYFAYLNTKEVYKLADDLVLKAGLDRDEALSYISDSFIYSFNSKELLDCNGRIKIKLRSSLDNGSYDKCWLSDEKLDVAMDTLRLNNLYKIIEESIKEEE